VPEGPVVTRATGPDVAEELSRWVAAGLLSAEQSAAILAHERAAQALAATPPTAALPVPPSLPSPPRRIPAAAEALGYLGGMLAIIGIGLVVRQYWHDMTTAGRLALSGAGALALGVAGAMVHEHADPALARLRSFLWLASTAVTALFAGVLVADALGGAPTTVVVACAGAVALESGLLWRGQELPLQELTLFGALVVFAGALVAEVASRGPVGLTVWAVGAVLVLLGLQRRVPLPLLAEVPGAVAVIVGAVLVATIWTAFGLLFALATATALMALAAVPGLASERADELVLAVIGGIALVGLVPSALGYFTPHAALATGLATWVVGAALILIGSRRLVRLPVVVEVIGGVTLLGGAALTGVQVHGFAPVFGIVTSVGLVALGMLPGQVLLSLLGSLGLLVFVPWTIGWFFPGKGRVPLLILVSGAMIIIVAVLLARMGGRFRQDLGGGGHAEGAILTGGRADGPLGPGEGRREGEPVDRTSTPASPSP